MFTLEFVTYALAKQSITFVIVDPYISRLSLMDWSLPLPIGVYQKTSRGCSQPIPVLETFLIILSDFLEFI